MTTTNDNAPAVSTVVRDRTWGGAHAGSSVAKAAASSSPSTTPPSKPSSTSIRSKSGPPSRFAVVVLPAA